MNLISIHEDSCSTPGLLSGLRVLRYRQLWCRSQAVAVVEAGSYSSDSTPSLGISICHGCDPKNTHIKITDLKYAERASVLQLINIKWNV